MPGGTSPGAKILDHQPSGHPVNLPTPASHASRSPHHRDQQLTEIDRSLVCPGPVP
jgi:hypothetical protein